MEHPLNDNNQPFFASQSQQPITCNPQQPSQPLYQQPVQPQSEFYQRPVFYQQNPPQQWALPARKQGKGITVAALVCSTCAIFLLFLALFLEAQTTGAGFGLFLISMLLEIAVPILLIVLVARR